MQSSFVLLNTDHVLLDQKWKYQFITSTFYRLYYIHKGNGELQQASKHTKLEAGYLYLIPSFTTCSYYCPKFLDQYYISFIEESITGIGLFAANRSVFKVKAMAGDFDKIKRIIQLNPGRGLTISHDPGKYEKQPVLQGFKDLNKEVPLWKQMETESIILYLLSRFVNTAQFETKTKKIDSKILSAIDYIQTHLHEKITVDDLAKQANQHPDHFSRLFFASTGERPLRFIQHKRVERAQVLLTSGTMGFAEIAAATGFESIFYFSRIFKKLTGQTPGEFRKNNGIV